MSADHVAELAKPYAQALFQNAREQNALDPIAEQAAALVEALAQEPLALRVLEDPSVSTEEKASFLERVLGGDRFHPLLGRFGRFLLAKNRIELLRDALRQYQFLYEQERGLAHGYVTSAQPLSAEERQKLAASLERYTGRQLSLEYTVDPRLIGGVRFQSGDLLIDDSLAGRLARLRGRLRNVKVA